MLNKLSKMGNVTTCADIESCNVHVCNFSLAGGNVTKTTYRIHLPYSQVMTIEN